MEGVSSGCELRTKRSTRASASTACKPKLSSRRGEHRPHNCTQTHPSSPPTGPVRPERAIDDQQCQVTHTCASASAAFRPSLEQSEMGQPWSRVEKGQAPLEMWR